MWRGDFVGLFLPIIRNTSQRVIPRQKRSEQPKVSTSLDQAHVGLSLGIGLQVADGQKEESEVERKEEHEKGDGGAQSAEQQDSREDEPAGEEEAEGVVEVVDVRGGRRVRGYDVEAAGGEHDADGDPEASVGGESCGTEGVSYGHFPVSRIRLRGNCYILGRKTYHMPASS
jgi:hypothetical protein